MTLSIADDRATKLDVIAREVGLSCDQIVGGMIDRLSVASAREMAVEQPAPIKFASKERARMAGEMIIREDDELLRRLA